MRERGVALQAVAASMYSTLYFAYDHKKILRLLLLFSCFYLYIYIYIYIAFGFFKDTQTMTDGGSLVPSQGDIYFVFYPLFQKYL
jgi:hypothetical protein